ncbi:MAG: type II/IV secretion system protein [Candidatus Magasanikbacteria bacterium]|nr:type II/IV secretion system protein [Candidatus Magasanikbacteria bacterium]
MGDLPSISDLLKKSKGAKSAPVSGSAVNYAADKFAKKMGEVAVKEKEREAMRLAASLNLPHIDLDKFPISQEALRQMPREDAERLETVCFYYTTEEFRLGTVNPENEEVKERLKSMEENLGSEGGLYVISQHSFDKVLEQYNRLPVIKPISKDVEVKPEDLEKVKASVSDFSSFQALLKKTSTTDLVTLLLGVAMKLDASDLHVEAESERIVVRVRLDGILQEAATLEKEVYKQLVSRIKLFSALKINITDKPQDGRFTIKLTGGDIDVRVSTIPTVYGESIVMRLLDQSRKGLNFGQLGLYGDAFEKLKQQIERPNGMVITTGPTGSGKTTTLYAILDVLNKPGVKIITLEDPVEYKLAGINQSQIDHSKNYTFATGLRSILRQDPDIVMVGEIRDLETADVAIQAALTGHLLFSTIHTNNAAGTIPRFLSMGVKPFLLAPALNAVIGQRLVRRICEKCKQKIELTAEIKKRVDEIIDNMPEAVKNETKKKDLVFYEGKGCAACNHLGFKGRIGIYEIFMMNPAVEQMILSGQVSEYEIEKAAIADGMVTMVQDGVLKSLEGVTTLEEVFRVIE